MDIVRGIINNHTATESLIRMLEKQEIDGTLYLGYPLRAMDDLKTSLDAMLVSKKYGLIVFSFDLVLNKSNNPILIPPIYLFIF